jgi:hypothetical protein
VKITEKTLGGGCGVEGRGGGGNVEYVCVFRESRCLENYTSVRRSVWYQ